jgi:hypothetical protein
MVVPLILSQVRTADNFACLPGANIAVKTSHTDDGQHLRPDVECTVFCTVLPPQFILQPQSRDVFTASATNDGGGMRATG